MEIITSFRKLLLAQVMLGIVAFCIASETPGLMVVGSALVILSWYLVEGAAGRPLPHWVIVCGAGVAATWLIFDLTGNVNHRNGFVLGIGYFTMALQMLLLFSENNREYGEILILSLMQLVCASVLIVSIAYGLLLAAYCGLAIFTVLAFQIKITADLVAQRTRQALVTTIPGSSAHAPAVGRGYRRQFRATAACLGLCCILIGIFVFIIAPRHETDPASTSQMLAAFHARQIGYTTQVDLNTLPDPANDNEPLLSLTLTRNGHRIEGDQSFHLRGTALDDYNYRTAVWSRSSRGDAGDEPRADVSTGAQLETVPPGARITEGHVVLRHSLDNTLFVLYPPVWVKSAQLDRITYSERDQRLGGHSNAGWPIEYDFRSLAGGGVGENGDSSPLGREDSYLREWNSPKADDIRQLALTILHDAGLDRDTQALSDPRDPQIASALAEYLRTHYAYTLMRQPIPGSTDPIYDFLFIAKRGHCEPFAAAFTALARSIGLTARMVSGFLVSEYSQVDGYFVVRQSNAHAWVEVYSRPGGWQEFDPTPAGNSEWHAAPRMRFAYLQELYDHVQFVWFDYIVAYNQRTRAGILGGLGQGGVTTWAWISDKLQEVVDLAISAIDGIVEHRFNSRVIAALLALGSLLSAGYSTHQWLTRRRTIDALQLGKMSPAQRKALARRLGFFFKTVELLERHGLIRPAWQTPMAFAQALGKNHDDRLSSLARLTEIFYEVRYGGRQIDADIQIKIDRHFQELDEGLRRRKTRPA